MVREGRYGEGREGYGEGREGYGEGREGMVREGRGMVRGGRGMVREGRGMVREARTPEVICSTSTFWNCSPGLTLIWLVHLYVCAMNV